MSKFIDMTGWKMWEHGVPGSFAEVIERVKIDGRKDTLWRCRCRNDGNIFVAGAYQLRNGRSSSCGCKRAMKAKRALSKTNIYSDIKEDEHGKYMIGYTTNNNTPFYFDAEDFDLIKNFCWIDYKMCNCRNFIILKAHVSKEQQDKYKITKTTILFHQLIGCKYYDHIDRNHLNNRKYNLRKCTHAQNSTNRSIQSNNKSGVIGICYYQNAWNVELSLNKKKVFLGRFQNFEEAVKVRLLAEIKYFGEFAPQKHLYKKYGVDETDAEI